MKSIIKTITTVLIVVISFASAEFVNANTATEDTLTSTTLTPDEREQKFEQIERSLLFGLESDVRGILESTFFNAIAFKTLNPEFNSDALAEGLTSIVREEGDHVVRYKAMLTLYYLNEKENFEYKAQLTKLVNDNDELGAFQLLDDQIRELQLASQVD